MITGINHITFAVSNLETSLHFYSNILGLKCVHQWEKGAYLLAGNQWIALNVDEKVVERKTPDYSHIAFHLPKEMFSVFQDRLRKHQIIKWHTNKSEGVSIYFLDPDGHKLEVHESDLENRMASILNTEAVKK